MLSHSKYYFESPARRLFLDGGPSEGGTPRADLFSGGLGETKNVTEWVKNGETTLEAKALARSLQERIEAIKREANLQLIQEYRYVFDEYILAPESYDSPETSVNDSFKGKGALYVLEQTCPLLKAQFKAYPDLRYLAYASATKQVPDVDVLPMGSTISMVDGMVHLKRPGKPDASFSLFPWDYRAEIEAKYQELKPKLAEAPASPVPPSDGRTTDQPSTPNFEEEEEEEFEMEEAAEARRGSEVEPELYEEGRDANLRTEWEEDVKPALMALEQTYPGVKVRIRDASSTPAKDKPKHEVDRWPNYGKHGKTVELIGEDGHIERFQILVPRKADSYFDDKVTLTHDTDPNLGVTWETVQNGAGLTEFFVQEAEELFAEEKLSTLLPADIQVLTKLPVDRQIHYLTDLVLQNAELLSKNPKTWTAQDRTALAQLYNGGLLENMTAWHQELSTRPDLTPAMKDNLKSIDTHLASFRAHRPNLNAEPAPVEKPAKTPEPEKAPSEKAASSYYSDYQVAMDLGDVLSAREALKEAQKHAKDGTLKGDVNLQALLEKIDEKYARVILELAPGETVRYSGSASPEVTAVLAYVNTQLASHEGRFTGLLPSLKQYTVYNGSGSQVRTFYVDGNGTTRVK